MRVSVACLNVAPSPASTKSSAPHNRGVQFLGVHGDRSIRLPHAQPRLGRKLGRHGLPMPMSCRMGSWVTPRLHLLNTGQVSGYEGNQPDTCWWNCQNQADFGLLTLLSLPRIMDLKFGTQVGVGGGCVPNPQTRRTWDAFHEESNGAGPGVPKRVDRVRMRVY